MRIIIIGELGGQLIPATQIASSKGAKVLHAPDITSAINTICSGKSAELIMASETVDIKSLIEQLRSQRISIPVVCCGFGEDSELAVEAIKAGAIDYLPLPPNEELISAFIESITKRDLEQDMIFASSAMIEAVNIAKKIAPSELNIILTGASGTGKEIMARFIHQNSKRKDHEMIAINCAAIPENLLESEMFGHEKGAFTGATERRIGKFEEANKSTIFLDEISEMDPKLQAKLLRVLQEKEISRIGSNKPIKLNIRFIAASNKNLEQEIKKGTFREDLFYRLNAINITLPALKDRIDDIESLAAHFIKKYAKINALPEKIIGTKALEKMKSYSWPGNIRELENCIHRGLVISSGDEIHLKDLYLKEEEAKKIETLEDVEKGAILNAIDIYGKDAGRIATALGVSIKLLQQKIKKYELDN
jgi:DNA-binding NtrC family response regulator